MSGPAPGGEMSQILPCCCQSPTSSSNISGDRSVQSFAWDSFRTPMKLDPQSLLRYLHSPRTDSKRVKAIRNEAESIDSSISRWTAQEYRQVMRRTHIFLVPVFLRVCLSWEIRKCPKTSIPQCKKGGVLQSRCSGRSAIFWDIGEPLRVLQVMQDPIIRWILFLPPTTL